jgi:hypothetical protein
VEAQAVWDRQLASVQSQSQEKWSNLSELIQSHRQQRAVVDKLLHFFQSVDVTPCYESSDEEEEEEEDEPGPSHPKRPRTAEEVTQTLESLQQELRLVAPLQPIGSGGLAAAPQKANTASAPAILPSAPSQVAPTGPFNDDFSAFLLHVDTSLASIGSQFEQTEPPPESIPHHLAQILLQLPSMQPSSDSLEAGSSATNLLEADTWQLPSTSPDGRPLFGLPPQQPEPREDTSTTTDASSSLVQSPPTYGPDGSSFF